MGRCVRDVSHCNREVHAEWCSEFANPFRQKDLNLTKLRMLLVFGTRPEAVKMAPIVLECRRRSDRVQPIVCVTGQHREMLTQITDYFGIRADVDFQLMSHGQSLSRFTARCLAQLEEVLVEYRPDCLVAQGDTTSVMAASLAAFYARLPLVHVEAGLRTGNLQSPWPEEFNRRVTTLAATLHCAPTSQAADNLLREGVAPDRVHVTGNPVIDALFATLQRERVNQKHRRSTYAMLGERQLVLITGHRRENFGDGMERICRAIATLAEMFPEVMFLYPVHLNPQVQSPVRALLGGRSNIYLRPPASYPEFVWLMDRATLILTDSGGIQEEATALGKPLFVMRETTERPEAVELGLGELVGTSVERISTAVGQLLSGRMPGKRAELATCPYGDGHAARRIVDLVIRHSEAGWKRPERLVRV